MDCEGIPGQENKLFLHRTDSCLNFKVHVATSSSQAFQWHFTKYTETIPSSQKTLPFARNPFQIISAKLKVLIVRNSLTLSNQLREKL